MAAFIKKYISVRGMPVVAVLLPRDIVAAVLSLLVMVVACVL